jgi:hypothetical protein
MNSNECDPRSQPEGEAAREVHRVNNTYLVFIFPAYIPGVYQAMGNATAAGI